MEMGRSYNGFRVRIAKVIGRLRFHLGGSGSNDQISLFLTCEDNGSIKKVSRVVFEGNCVTTWCTSLDSVD